MVRAVLLLAGAGLIALAMACSSDDGEQPASTGGGAQTTARPTSAPTRPSTGPAAIVDPKSGPPGSEVTVTGSGWPSGVLVDLTGKVPAGAQAPKPYATVLTDGSGGFVAHFRLEKTADGGELAVGRYDLIARTSSVQIDIPFLVETRRPIRNPGPGG